MKRFNLDIDDTTLKCSVAKTAEERKKGLSGEGVELGADECMLFVFPSEGSHRMWMKDTHIPLDIVFLDKNIEVLEIVQGEENNVELLGNSDKISYVIELNKGACKTLDIGVGDILEDIPEEYLEPDEDEEYSMYVLDDEGNVQMEIKGGERIFSRKSTKKIVNMALSAGNDSQYKKLAKTILGEILAQDGREPDYVKGKTKESYNLGK